MARRGQVALVLQRKGGAEVDELPWATLNWGRVLDDMGSASATVAVARRGHRLARQLADVDAFEHELAVVVGSTRLWVGPVFEPKWNGGGVAMQARDLFQWYERRLLWFDRAFAGVDLIEPFAQYAVDAMEEDPSPNIVLEAHPTGVLGDRSVAASAHKRAADEMRELSRDAVDFTMVGRTLLAGGADLPLPSLPQLTDDMVTDPEWTGNGSLRATRPLVMGNSTGAGAAPPYAYQGLVDPEAGLVERVWSEPLTDENSCVVAAQTRYAALRQTPLYLSVNLMLRRCPPLDQLVPGSRWPVDVTAGVKRVNQMMRLSSVSVSLRAEGGRSEQTASVTLIPLGSEED